MEAAMANTNEHWAVVGGGILGMTLAHRLAQQGQRVTLFEAAKHMGGLASAWTLGEVIWDRHYHVTLLSDSYTRSLLTELGLESDMRWVQTRTGFYTDGRLHSMSNTVEFLTFPPLGIQDKLRLGATIFYASQLKDGQRLESRTVGDWLEKLSGRRTFQKIWLPLLRAKLGDSYKETSATFIWATIARMYAARRTGLKKEMFGYLPGGYARILDALTKLLASEKVEIELDHRVERVTSSPGGGLKIEFDCRRAREFDRVVMTVPSTLTAKTCPQLTAEERDRLLGVRYQGVICASVLMKQSLSPFYVTNLTDSWVPFTAVIEMSALVDKSQFGGNALVYLPKYVPPDDPLFAASDDEIRESFLSALERIHPHFNRESVLAFRVSRVRQVVALPTLNYSARVPPMETSIPGLHIVNSSQILDGTLNVNETVHLAEKSLRALTLTRNSPELQATI
jgi:protoporphyrinogen oxidase